MDKNVEAIVRKFLKDSDKFELIPLDNQKDNTIFGAFPKGIDEYANVGLPIYILIDKLGNVRYTDSNEQHELLIRSQSEELESSSNTPLDNIQREASMRLPMSFLSLLLLRPHNQLQHRLKHKSSY